MESCCVASDDLDRSHNVWVACERPVEYLLKLKGGVAFFPVCSHHAAAMAVGSEIMWNGKIGKNATRSRYD